MILNGDGHSNIEKLILQLNCKAKRRTICVLHNLKALKECGRMALVVPEGFLFNKELKEVRKFLISNANLELIVSLPQGVFQPYTGVKTDVLYFTNAHKPVKQDGYFYFEVKNYGYNSDAHRRKIGGNNDIHTPEEVNLKRTEKELLLANGFEFVPFEKIKQADYNFVGAGYREIESKGRWGMVRLGDVCELSNGYAFKSEYFSKI